MRVTIPRLRAWQSKVERAERLLTQVEADLRMAKNSTKGSDFSLSDELLAASLDATVKVESLRERVARAVEVREERAIAKQAGGHRQPVNLPPLDEWED